LHVTTVEVSLKVVHDVDFLRTSMSLSHDGGVGQNSDTYRSEAFVLVKWIPAKAHHHRVHLSLMVAEPIHLCIAEVDPRSAHAAHRDN
jgi:hypothetical protein